MVEQALHVIKIGGNVIDNEPLLHSFLLSFSTIPGPKILVHGGGKKATRVAQRLGVPTNMHQGRRITDAATLEIAVMVYGGLVNKQIVARLQAMGSNALGLTGADQDCLRAKKRAVGDIDFGFVGDIEEVNVKAISGMLQSRIIPVFCALTHDNTGQLLNTNADHIACSLAGAMSAHYPTQLYYVFEKNGVLSDPQDENSVITRIDRMLYSQHLKSGAISKGMIPKMENAFEALEKGVALVYICSPDAIRQRSMVNATTVCL